LLRGHEVREVPARVGLNFELTISDADHANGNWHNEKRLDSTDTSPSDDGDITEQE